MGCCASTSPKAQTSHAGASRTSRPSPQPSTAAPARHSIGRHPPKHWTSTYDQLNRPVLLRPVESGWVSAVLVIIRRLRHSDAPSIPARLLVWPGELVQDGTTTKRSACGRAGLRMSGKAALKLSGLAPGGSHE